MTIGAVRFEQVDSIPLAVMRGQATVAELSRVVPRWCGLVWNALKAQRAKGGRHVAIYWDSAIRLEVGVEMLGTFEDAGDFVRSATPAGLVAWVTHHGPYNGLGAAHEAIRQWCNENGHRLAGPNWEIYGHWEETWNANPNQIRTDVFYLVSPAMKV